MAFVSLRPSAAASAVPVEAAATAIFRRFDKDNDGRLNRDELSSFVQQVNPSMRFTADQMEAILDELLIEYAAHADNGGMKLGGLTAAYRDGVGNFSADLTALGLRAEEVLSFVGAAAASKEQPSPPSKRGSRSPSPSPPAARRPLQLAVRATATFKSHPSRSPSPVRRAAAALADVLALTSPEKARGGGRNGGGDGASCGGLPQSPAIAEAFRAAGFAAGRPPTESEEGRGVATLAAASSAFAASAAASAAAVVSAAAEEQKPPPPRRRFWPPAAHAANSSPLGPPAMTRPAAAAAAAAPAAPAAKVAARAVRFDLGAYETPPPQTRKRQGCENESGKGNAAAAAAAAADGDREEDENASSDADDEACIASLMGQGQAAASAGRHAAAAAAYGSAAKLAAGRCSSRGRGGAHGARDPLTPAPRPRVCSRALFRLGNSLFAMGQPAAAEAAFLESLRVMEEDICDDDGEGKVAEEEDDESSRGKGRAPSSSSFTSSSSSSSDARLATSLRVNLGIALEAQGMLAAAADQYAAAAAAADGLAESERSSQAATTTAAAAASEKPLPHHRAHSRAYKLLGSALFALGRPAAARDALQRALSIDAGYADALCDLGCALCALGDATGAAAAFSAALRASSQDGESGESKGKKNTGPHREALFNLANLRRQTGDFAAAVCGYDRVLDLDQGHWRAHLGRAVALMGSGRDGDARGALRIAFALSGVNPLALEAELKMLREAAAAPNPERATLAAAMAAVAERAAAEVAAAKEGMTSH